MRRGLGNRRANRSGAGVLLRDSARRRPICSRPALMIGRRSRPALPLHADCATDMAATTRDGRVDHGARYARVSPGAIEGAFSGGGRHARRRRWRRQTTARSVQVLRPFRADAGFGQLQRDASVGWIETDLGRRAERVAAGELPTVRQVGITRCFVVRGIRAALPLISSAGAVHRGGIAGCSTALGICAALTRSGSSAGGSSASDRPREEHHDNASEHHPKDCHEDMQTTRRGAPSFPPADRSNGCPLRECATGRSEGRKASRRDRRYLHPQRGYAHRQGERDGRATDGFGRVGHGHSPFSVMVGWSVVLRFVEFGVLSVQRRTLFSESGIVSVKAPFQFRESYGFFCESLLSS